VDGNLTDHWSLPPAATQWQPLNGKCFDDMVETTSSQDYAPIDCRQRHITETFAVGNLDGDAATAAAARAGAYLGCARQADAFVGGAWRTGRLVVQAVLPDDAGWKGGARWYRCDIAQNDDDLDLVARDASLRGALKSDPDLPLRCFNPTVSGDNVRAMTAVDCGRPHHAEFAGLWIAPKIALSDLQGSPQLAKGCLSAIARYTEVPDDSMIRYRTGWLGFPFNDTAWNAGDRTVQCYLWLSGETMKGSYQGAGPKKFKIHYA
jgi:hypothetical protein